MTNRLSLDPPLASADTWAGRSRRAFNCRLVHTWWESRQSEIEQQAAKEQRRDEVTPLAEHVVLDCLRALKAVSPSPHAMELTDMISRGYLDTPNQITRMRRIAALLEISAEEAAS